jgi:hypothetical protein
MHAERTGINNWQLESIGTEPGVGPSIAIGENGLGVISYTHGEDPHQDDFCLWCAIENPEGEWTCQVLDPNPRSGTAHCVDIDENNIPHILYIRYSQRILVHIYKSQSGWHDEFVADLISEGIWGPGMLSMNAKDSSFIHAAFRRRPDTDHVLTYADRS